MQHSNGIRLKIDETEQPNFGRLCRAIQSAIQCNVRGNARKMKQQNGTCVVCVMMNTWISWLEFSSGPALFIIHCRYAVATFAALLRFRHQFQIYSNKMHSVERLHCIHSHRHTHALKLSDSNTTGRLSRESTQIQ